MIYTINGRVTFCSSAGTLAALAVPDVTLALTSTTARLLTFLLDRAGAVTGREAILKEVWEAHGLRASNHSLNKYVSDLRSALKQLGEEEEVIVTVPRVGFMIAAEARIEKMPDAVPAAAINALTPVPLRDARRLRNLRVAVAAAAIVIALTLTFLFRDAASDVNNPPAEALRSYPLGQIAGCAVHQLTPLSAESAPQRLAIVNRMLTQEHITCPKDGLIFFDTKEPIRPHTPVRVFLSVCQVHAGRMNHFDQCQNYYESSYEFIP
ncbi:winged helix-turn-helix domain-containing protein [Pantoea sp. 1.19]|uniref:winged helix-turn-helix domain-containing protein n=1 Tax=Pantoea sp. 1.19 TaxID=1925589 RepID=UPI0009489FE1|nr:winged helix-turn-helix domain-containing protein [Pantoea sp. 1.19]